MAVLSLAIKNFKAIAKNFLLMIFLIVVPLLQLYMIKIITNNAMSGSGTETYNGFVDMITTSNINYGNLLEVYTAGILVQFILLTGMIAGSTMVGEREQNTLARIYAAPISKAKMLTGMLLGHSAVVAIVTLSIIAFTYFGFGVKWGSSWGSILLVTILAVYVAVAMAFVISGIFKSSKLAGGVMSLVVIGMTFMSGGIIQSESLDIISNFTINKWISEAYLKLMSGSGLGDIMINVLILATMGTAMLLIASLIYRKERVYE